MDCLILTFLFLFSLLPISWKMGLAYLLFINTVSGGVPPICPPHCCQRELLKHKLDQVTLHLKCDSNALAPFCHQTEGQIPKRGVWCSVRTGLYNFVWIWKMSLGGSWAAMVCFPFVWFLLSKDRNWNLSLEIPFVQRDHFDSHLYSYNRSNKKYKKDLRIILVDGWNWWDILSQGAAEWDLNARFSHVVLRTKTYWARSYEPDTLLIFFCIWTDLIFMLTLLFSLTIDEIETLRWQNKTIWGETAGIFYNTKEIIAHGCQKTICQEWTAV